MPIKVRCNECSTVLTVSDKAAGKAIKCRECGARVEVGSGQRKKKRPRPRPQEEDFGGGSPDDGLFGVDLRRAADTKRRVCPNCAAAVGEEDTECANCGVNIDTGILSERERVRRARKGPPPEEFYGAIWSDAWTFLMKHKGYAVRTGIIWGLTSTMAICSAFTLDWYLARRELQLRESAEGKTTVTDNAVIIEPGDDEAFYDGKRYTQATIGKEPRLVLPGPAMGAMQSPPTYFWVSMISVFILAFGGWAWILSTAIVELSLAGKKKIKRFQTDLFANMAMGFRTIFWPMVLMAPIVWIPGLVFALTNNQIVTTILWCVIFLVPILVFLPAALVHMTQHYTYRGWLIYWMGRDLFRTFVPSLYVGALLFFFVLIIPVTLGVLSAVFWNDLSSFYLTRIEQPALNSMLGYDPQTALDFFPFTFYRFPFLFVVAFTGCSILFMLLAFPAIFMMRVYGLFGVYFKADLSLINEQVELEPAGFGPRFLAYLIDYVLMLVLNLVALFVSVLLSLLLGYLWGMSNAGRAMTQLALNTVGSLTLIGLYFATWESGQNRATLGKAALGLVVLNDDDTAMTMKTACGRAASAFVTAITLFLGFVMCAFRSDHKAMHDLMSKTKVVWRGEDES